MNLKNANNACLPKIARMLLRLTTRFENRDLIIGDMTESYNYDLKTKGFLFAFMMLWGDLFRSIPEFYLNKIQWGFIMFKNYLKIALRNMQKQKVFSLITLSGLVLGLAIFMNFALMNETLSKYDQFHENADRIFSIVQIFEGGSDGRKHSAVTPAPLLPQIQNTYPEIEKASRYMPAGRAILKYNDKIFYENGLKFVDNDFLSMFSFDMITGSPSEVLSKPYTAVINKRMKTKYFGDEPAIGKTLSINNKFDVVITGLIENNPANSSLRFDMLVSIETAKAMGKELDDWKDLNYASFVMLNQNADKNQLEESFPNFIAQHYKVSNESPEEFYLHSLTDFFFKSRDIEKYWGSGGGNFIVLWALAGMLLFIASINFMNLLTARYITRAKEVGMRKVIGANRSQLVKQFLSESILMAFIALPIAIVVFSLIQPMLATYMGDIFEYTLWERPQILILVSLVTLASGLFAGSYPAFYLSKFSPGKVLKGDQLKGQKGSGLRKVLVAAQFAVSIILIILTIVSLQQAEHNRHIDLGYDRTDIIFVEIQGDAKTNLETFQKQVEQFSEVITVTSSTSLPASWNNEEEVAYGNMTNSETVKMNTYGVDYNFSECLGLNIIDGRSFNRDYEESSSCLINKKAVEKLQWENPIGKQLKLNDKILTVVGVTNDYHFSELYFEQIGPALMFLEEENLNYLLAKVNSGTDIKSIAGKMEEEWKLINPGLPYEYDTIDEHFEDVNIRNDYTAEVSGMIGGLAIFLSCLGLLALSAYSVERKVKEIGIRKVLGASSATIISMLAKDFMVVVVIANIVGLPIAYYLVDLMLSFLLSYPVPIGPGVFIGTFIGTLLIAFITVTSQTLKAAHSNPAESLRSE